MSILIAIGGVSRSGKSTLAEWLGGELKNATVLHQDEYALPKDQLPKIKDLPNWELPESINWTAWHKAVTQAKTEYDHVIIEGILVFANTKINALIDQSVYLGIDKVDFFRRRLKEKRWGKEPEWFIEYVWEAHLKYGLPPSELKAIHIKDIKTSQYIEVLRALKHQG
ncbi:uridine kinase family protein [Roseivirga echinicomitans]